MDESDRLRQYREFRERMNARILEVGAARVIPHLRRAMATIDDIAAERLREA